MVWGRHVRPSAAAAEGVLYCWPIGKDARIDLESLTPAKGYGFVEIENGFLLACVDPSCSDDVARALLRARPDPAEGSPVGLSCWAPRDLVTVSDGGATCADVRKTSYLRDFDVENGVPVLEPVVGVEQDGAVVSARAVPSAGPGVYDVRVEHAVAERPFPTFRTGAGAGGEITLQLPRVRRHSTWLRVRAEPDQAVPLETTLDLGGDRGEDVRRFLLRRLR